MLMNFGKKMPMFGVETNIYSALHERISFKGAGDIAYLNVVSY